MDRFMLKLWPVGYPSLRVTGAAFATLWTTGTPGSWCPLDPPGIFATHCALLWTIQPFDSPWGTGECNLHVGNTMLAKTASGSSSYCKASVVPQRPVTTHVRGRWHDRCVRIDNA